MAAFANFGLDIYPSEEESQESSQPTTYTEESSPTIGELCDPLERMGLAVEGESIEPSQDTNPKAPSLPSTQESSQPTTQEESQEALACRHCGSTEVVEQTDYDTWWCAQHMAREDPPGSGHWHHRK